MVAAIVYSILFLDWLAMLVAHIVVRWFTPMHRARKSGRAHFLV
jgi:hypothetical protein